MNKRIADPEAAVPGRAFGRRAASFGQAGKARVVSEASRLSYAHALCDLSDEILALHPEAARHLDRAAELILRAAPRPPR